MVAKGQKRREMDSVPPNGCDRFFGCAVFSSRPLFVLGSRAIAFRERPVGPSCAFS